MPQLAEHAISMQTLLYHNIWIYSQSWARGSLELEEDWSHCLRHRSSPWRPHRIKRYLGQGCQGNILLGRLCFLPLAARERDMILVQSKVKPFETFYRRHGKIPDSCWRNGLRWRRLDGTGDQDLGDSLKTRTKISEPFDNDQLEGMGHQDMGLRPRMTRTRMRGAVQDLPPGNVSAFPVLFSLRATR
ncbi:hypothetical protein QCA50_010833 [Cerrena zonata]|uniref:Uncharacterized protein n=1 Tax=Cerrena zonata TaxID=2478898 RepID=A0AAW0G883_9APHY